MYCLSPAILAGLFFSKEIYADSIADPPNTKTAYISLIIDDLGDRLRDGQRAVALPGSLTYSILPFTPHAQVLAQMAYGENKEVILHLPMQAEHAHPMGKGGLYENMSQSEFRSMLDKSLQAVPHIVGINNHMGSLLTQRTVEMQWLMQGLAAHTKLYFLDSRTTPNSQAEIIAQQYGIAHARRDVFLDNERDVSAIQQQWLHLLHRAKTKGSAIAIAHPREETLNFLQQVLPHLAEQNIRLVCVSQLLQLRERRLPWQTFLSPSRKAAKNSKL